MTAASWIVLVAFVVFIAARLGYLAGRERAESRAYATIADLRLALRAATRRQNYDDRRPQ